MCDHWFEKLADGTFFCGQCGTRTASIEAPIDWVNGAPVAPQGRYDKRR